MRRSLRRAGLLLALVLVLAPDALSPNQGAALAQFLPAYARQRPRSYYPVVRQSITRSYAVTARASVSRPGHARHRARSYHPTARRSYPRSYARGANRAYARNSRQALRIVTTSTDYRVPSLEEVKVRWTNLPTVFDDRGVARKYTAAELKELKGPNPNLPGYQGDFGDLKAGQLVRVSLAQNQAALDEKPRWVSTRQLTGRLTQVESTRDIILRVETQALQARQGAKPPAKKTVVPIGNGQRATTIMVLDAGGR